MQINYLAFSDSPEPTHLDNLNYMEAMSHSGVWGDGVMIEAAAMLYKRPILVVFISHEGRCEEFPITPETIQNEQPLYLGFVQCHQHFVSLQNEQPLYLE